MTDSDEIVVKESPGLCRCCLFEGCYKDLDSEYSWMSETEIYADMLLECFDINISQNPAGLTGCNRLICEVCITRLRDAFTFKKQVLESEKIFVDMVGRGEFKPEVLLYQPQMKTEITMDLEDAADDAALEYEYVDYVDEDLLKNEDYIEASVSEDTTVSALSVKVKRGRGRPRKVKLKRGPGRPRKNSTVVKPKKAKVPKLEDKPTKSKPVAEESSHCAEWCSVKQEPAPAAGSPGDAPRSGKSCGEQLALRTCSDSLQRIPLDNELHKCTSCHETFLRECSLKTHSCIYSAEETSSNIIQRQLVFEDSKRKKSYLCDSCGKRFISKADFRRHILFHTGEKPFKCDICTKQFTQKQYISRHMLIHKGEKPFKCNSCMKQFRSKQSLTNHVFIHTGEKPFKCTICTKRFSRTHHLAGHMLIHTGEQLFACQICKKRFSHKHNLTKHLFIHTRRNP